MVMNPLVKKTTNFTFNTSKFFGFNHLHSGPRDSEMTKMQMASMKYLDGTPAIQIAKLEKESFKPERTPQVEIGGDGFPLSS